MAALVAAAALLVAWWAETRATIIIVELKVIRANLDKLRADRTEKDGDKGESSERGPELPKHAGNR
jgi:hypothetical protein